MEFEMSIKIKIYDDTGYEALRPELKDLFYFGFFQTAFEMIPLGYTCGDIEEELYDEVTDDLVGFSGWWSMTDNLYADMHERDPREDC